MRHGSSRTALSAAAFWGFAEATFFFIVPDVLLTGLALSSLKKAVFACIAAAIGAVAGGLVIAGLAATDTDLATSLLLKVPGISEATFARVDGLTAGGRFLGMLEGAFLGVPYKVFAARAGSAGLPFLSLAMLTFAARLPRFLVLSLVAYGLSRLVGTRLTAKKKILICLLIWAGFYSWYFSVVGW